MRGQDKFDEDYIEIIDWGEEQDNEIIVNSTELKKPEKKKVQDEPIDWRKEFIGWVKIVVFAIVAAFIIDNVLIVNAEVPSGSMENTIMTDSRMIGWRWSYAFDKKPQRGDVIIFKYPDDTTKNYVKRVIGLPGDRVKVEDGIAYVNDEPLDEPYVVFKDKNDNLVQRDNRGDFEEVQVPNKSYFVMGDNRYNSWDSRYWVSTNFVSEDKILGKAVLCYWHNGPEFELLE